MENKIFKCFFTNKNNSIKHERLNRFSKFQKQDLTFVSKQAPTPIDQFALVEGVCVGLCPKSNDSLYLPVWNIRTCNYSDKDIVYINNLIHNWYGASEFSSYDFFVINSQGKVLSANCVFDTSIDKNGTIHLENKAHKLDHYIYPADRKDYPLKKYYCFGRSLDELNKDLINFSKQNVITLPRNFKKEITQEVKKSKDF